MLALLPAAVGEVVAPQRQMLLLMRSRISSPEGEGWKFACSQNS